MGDQLETLCWQKEPSVAAQKAASAWEGLTPALPLPVQRLPGMFSPLACLMNNALPSEVCAPATSANLSDSLLLIAPTAPTSCTGVVPSPLTVTLHFSPTNRGVLAERVLLSSLTPGSDAQ